VVSICIESSGLFYYIPPNKRCIEALFPSVGPPGPDLRVFVLCHTVVKHRTDNFLLFFSAQQTHTERAGIHSRTLLQAVVRLR
jgi:hypothetical protein